MHYILVVNDNAINRLLISYLLEEEGIKVAQACDGLQALELIDSQVPDLVITDIQMPRMSGCELCDRLKSNPKTRSIPIIVFPGMDKESVLHLKIGCDADAYIPNTVDSTEFHRIVLDLLPD